MAFTMELCELCGSVVTSPEAPGRAAVVDLLVAAVRVTPRGALLLIMNTLFDIGPVTTVCTGCDNSLEVSPCPLTLTTIPCCTTPSQHLCLLAYCTISSSHCKLYSCTLCFYVSVHMFVCTFIILAMQTAHVNKVIRSSKHKDVRTNYY